MNGAVPHSSVCLSGMCRTALPLRELMLSRRCFWRCKSSGCLLTNTGIYELFTKRHNVTSQKTSVFLYRMSSRCVVNSKKIKSVSVQTKLNSICNMELHRVKKNQLDAQLFVSILRQSVHVSGLSRPIIRMYKRMYTTVGTYYSS